MPNTGKILALHSNDIVFLVWQYQKEILDCLGFTVRRKDMNAPSPSFQPLPAWVGWQGGSNEDWQPKTTDVWPVQKFSWRDFTAKPGATYQYQVIPMTGTPDSLQPEEDLLLTSEEVTLTPHTSDNIDAYFNNGILSTQHISHMIPPGSTGAPNYQKLVSHIQTPGDPLRGELAGQMIDAVLSLLQKAQAEGGECYAALYELNDKQLISELLKTGNRLHLILSTAGTNDATDKVARQQLHQAGIDITDRMLDLAHIGHNKFVVYVDADGHAQSVLAGSTNWTYTGLCAQSNNSVIINNPTIASFYRGYWERIKQDTLNVHGVAKNLQGPQYRQSNGIANVAGNTTVWFSPNTAVKTKPKGATLTNGTPPDLAHAFQAIHDAKEAILFLQFQPGSPSVLDVIEEMEQDNPKLFIRGAATDAQAIGRFDDQHPITTELYHRSATGAPDVVYETGVAATAINDEFAYWKKELLKSSPQAHAIIHDKIVVIDPLSETDCVVITGSHNDGYKASYCNDENLLILRGNQPLALAYTTHVMDVYDHYRWRYMIQQQKQNAWTGLQTTPQWQDKYFEPGNMAYQELEFWLSGTVQASTGVAPSPGISAPAPPPIHKVTPPVGQPVGPLQIPVHSTPVAHPSKPKRRTNGERRPR
jgi:phosphatidylserine/phosphatidylglycerophosphate/cardiolipin synthase-like enzyme